MRFGIIAGAALIATFMSGSAYAQDRPKIDRKGSIRALEQAYRANAVPSILLSIASTYDEWEGHCREALGVYQRFFTACKDCPEMDRAMHAHPTLSEAIGEGALAALGRALHI